MDIADMVRQGLKSARNSWIQHRKNHSGKIAIDITALSTLQDVGVPFNKRVQKPQVGQDPEGENNTAMCEK